MLSKYGWERDGSNNRESFLSVRDECDAESFGIQNTNVVIVSARIEYVKREDMDP